MKFEFEGMNYWWANCMECDTTNIITSQNETIVDPDSDPANDTLQTQCNNCEDDLVGQWNEGLGT